MAVCTTRSPPAVAPSKEGAGFTFSIGTSGLRASPGLYQIGGPSGITKGWSSNQRRFDGDISKLATYEYVLTPAEIQAHYKTGHL